MKIIILTENFAGGRLQAEHGLSYLIDLNGKKLLFDTGHSDLFLKNAEQLGIDIINEVENIVLSHGHWDHGDGLRFLENKTLITHPEAFMKRFRKIDDSYIGLALDRSDIEKKFKLELSEGHLVIAPKLVYLGAIPRENDFESKSTPFKDESGSDDFVMDDSGLAIILDDELVVISGCAHAGICNTIEHAIKVTGIKTVKAVLGGFHLKARDAITNSTIRYLKENRIQYIYPSHCTELPALAAFHETFQIKQIKTGSVLTF